MQDKFFIITTCLAGFSVSNKGPAFKKCTLAYFSLNVISVPSCFTKPRTGLYVKTYLQNYPSLDFKECIQSSQNNWQFGIASFSSSTPTADMTKTKSQYLEDQTEGSLLVDWFQPSETVLDLSREVLLPGQKPYGSMIDWSTFHIIRLYMIWMTYIAV